MSRIEELFEKVEAINTAMESLRNIDNLYDYYPDDLSTAQAVWSLMSEAEKKSFTDGLITTDAASEGIAEAWTEWIADKGSGLTEESIQRIIDGVESYVSELLNDLDGEIFDVDSDNINEYELSLSGFEVMVDSVRVEVNLSDIDINLYSSRIRDIIKSEL